MVGVGRRDQEHEDFRDAALDSIQSLLAAQARRRRCSRGCSTTCATCRARSTTTRSTRSCERTLEEFDDQAGREPGPRLLPLDRARVLPADRRQARRGRAQRRARMPTVRIVIEKPFGYDLASARKLNARAARGLRGAPDLPHRPLPGQGDGPEPDGAALRQRAVRAGLEPQLHRSRADHGGRGHRHRRPRRLLRGRRGAARPRPEPHAAAARAAGHGAADGVRRRPAARREAQGARGDRAPGSARTCRRWRFAPSTRPGSSAGNKVPGLPGGGRRRRRTRGPRPTRRCACTSPTGAGPGCRSTCAPASIWRAS